ncbi:MAG: D-alanyl-D-alanine carboxypeptidase family protein [Clostridia bacterium]
MKHSKKIFTFFIFIIICNLVSYTFAASLEENTQELEASIDSGAVLILEETTGKVIYEQNGYKRMFPASTTKIMTAILTIENCNLDETATASEYAINSIPEGYTNASIQVGEVLTVKDLLYALMVTSANESAIVLAEHVAGSEEAFCWMMNDKAKEIGCQDTHFVNPNGIHSEDHYSTAYDLALIANYAMQNETFREIVKTTSYTLPSTNAYPREDRTFTNTNSLIIYDNRNRADNYYYEYATGIKTGYTSQAGNCLVSSAEKNGMSYITVVLNAPVGYTAAGTISHRYLDTIALFNFAFDNYSFRKLKSKNALIETITIDNGEKDANSLDLLISDEVNVLASIDNRNSEIEPEVTLNDNLSAPISKGEVVGTITYRVEGLKYTTDLVAGNDVKVQKKFNIKFFILISIVILLLVIVFVKRQIKLKKKYRYNRNKYI